jgi:protein-glutamine gamma-glutamyltransferase
MSSVSFATSHAGRRPTPWSRVASTIAAREREVRDTLWLLLTLSWVLAPHALVLPLWCSFSIAMLILWRAWITWNGHRLPHRLIPIALTCIAGIAVWLQYRTIFGKDAGVAYVTLLLGLKLLEMRARRDIFVVIFLCLFVMLTSLFESQSMVMAGVLMVGMWMLVTALVSVQFATFEPRWRTKAAIAMRLVLFSLPLMAVLFVLFPRIDGPLWGMPSDAYATKTGLSDVMAPGSFGRLSESREMAFRVHFDGRVPKPSERYWRGPVFGVFDGRAWTALPGFANGGSRSIAIDPGSAIDYTVTLEPSNRPWLFAMDITTDRPVGRSTSSPLAPRVRSDLQVISESLVRDRTSYSARSYTRYHAGVDETRGRLQTWLELPPDFNPRTRAFAAQMLMAEGNVVKGSPPVDDAQHTRNLVARVLTMIRTQSFVYTLDPPPLGRNSVDEFLFDTRRGYCEHYASAFVFLMRALDVPSRVVTGYQGGEINPVDQFLEVRQRDAHAWAEVWIAGEGWTRVDPTAAVAPDRIERGAAETFDAAQGFGAQGSWLGSLLQQTRFNWDAVGNAWNQWVLAYNADRQSGLLSGLGIERIDWQTLTIALIVMFGAVLAGIGALTLFRRIKVDPVVLQYEKACALLARAVHGGSASYLRRTLSTEVDEVARKPAEGSHAYLERIQGRLPAMLRARAQTAFAIYEELRYGRPGDATHKAVLRARFAASVAALRERTG